MGWESQIAGRSRTGCAVGMTAAPSNLMNHLGDPKMAALEHLRVYGKDDVTGTHDRGGVARGITANTVGSALERPAKKGMLLRRKVALVRTAALAGGKRGGRRRLRTPRRRVAARCTESLTEWRRRCVGAATRARGKIR